MQMTERRGAGIELLKRWKLHDMAITQTEVKKRQRMAGTGRGGGERMGIGKEKRDGNCSVGSDYRASVLSKVRSGDHAAAEKKESTLR